MCHNEKKSSYSNNDLNANCGLCRMQRQHSASTIPISAMPSFSTPSPTVEDTENQQSKTVNYLINSMTLEEKIGQIFKSIGQFYKTEDSEL